VVEQELFNTCSPETRKVIVDIGCSVYKNLECITNVCSKDNEQHIQERINMLMSNKSKTIEFLQNELDTFNEKKNEEISTWKIQIDELREELQRCRNEHENNKNAELSRFENACNQTIQSLRDQISTLEDVRDIQEKQLKTFEKSKNMKTVELGIEGEQTVMDYIGQTFSEGKLQDTTKKGWLW
jgi:molecular chaperone GrpE (heat shock protein)